MYSGLFEEFVKSADSVRIYERRRLLFASDRKGLYPLLDYLKRPSMKTEVVIFDRVVGNAAALLAIKAGCKQIFSPLGSQRAVITLERNNIRFRFTKIVSFICNDSGQNMCPMERLSLDKTPEEFYQIVKASPVSKP